MSNYLHAIQKWASLFQTHPTEYISKICSFSNRIFEIKRIYYALEFVTAPFLNSFFHFSCLIFGNNQVKRRSATFNWAARTPHHLELFICHSTSVVLLCLSPVITTEAAPQHVPSFFHRFSLSVTLRRAQRRRVMIQVVFFALLQYHPRSQLVVTDLGRYSWREFNPQVEDTPIQSDTTCTPGRCFSFLAGEYAESLQTLVSWVHVQDWETTKMPKAILHIKRGFRVCLRNCESSIIAGISSKLLLSVEFWLERSVSGIIGNH